MSSTISSSLDVPPCRTGMPGQSLDLTHIVVEEESLTTRLAKATADLVQNGENVEETTSIAENNYHGMFPFDDDHVISGRNASFVPSVLEPSSNTTVSGRRSRRNDDVSDWNSFVQPQPSRKGRHQTHRNRPQRVHDEYTNAGLDTLSIPYSPYQSRPHLAIRPPPPAPSPPLTSGTPPYILEYLRQQAEITEMALAKDSLTIASQIMEQQSTHLEGYPATAVIVEDDQPREQTHQPANVDEEAWDPIPTEYRPRYWPE